MIKKNYKIHISIFIFLINGICSAQSFEKTFSGQWAMTTWSYEFHKDGTYKRTSSGHYGNPEYTGHYSVQGDTIHMLTGFENTHGTVNEYYLLDEDSFLVDLENFYDYKWNTDSWFYTSKKRYDVLPKPNMDSVITISKKEFDEMVVYCTSLLKKKVYEVNDKDHIKIIRCYNTVWIESQRFSDPLYQDFWTEINKTGYSKEISDIYDWIPNRGLGFYFQKLQIELGGTPHLWSRYNVVE